MPIAKLTTHFVAKAACPEDKGKMEYFDQRQKGFLLEVRASGGKTYYQRYTDDHGLKRQYRIGPADILTLDQARDKGKSIVAQAHLGDDPQSQRQAKRAILTFREVVSDHYLPHARQHKRSWKTDEIMLRVHLVPAFGSKPLDTITAQDIREFVSRKQKQGYAAGTVNRFIILTRYIYNLAAKWQLGGSDHNPTKGISLAPTSHRDRYLTREEAQALIASCAEDENQTAAQAILLLLLTGARRNEVTHAKWEYIDWQRGTLFVPLSKSGKPRTIALTPRGVALLQRLPRLDGNPYIFPSPVTGEPSPSLFYPWVRIRDRAGLTNMRLHDLRHSFASFLVNQGASLYVVQHLLGHTQPRTTQRYAHLAPETMQEAAQIAGNVIEGELAAEAAE